MAVKPHIVMLPTPGMGHLIPLTGFAKVLVQSHDLTITLIVLTIGPQTKPQKDLLQALPPTINPILVSSSEPETNVFVAINQSMSPVRDVFKSLVESDRPRELIVDLLTTDFFDVTMEFKIPSYAYFISSALSLALMFALPNLDGTVSCEFKDLPESLKLPGSVPVYGRDFPAELQDRSKDSYKWFLNQANILNSFTDLEPGTIEALQMEEPNKPLVYAIGPRIQTGPSGG